MWLRSLTHQAGNFSSPGWAFETRRSSGYASVEWVLGRPDTRLPGSLLQDGEQERLEILEAADPNSMMGGTDKA